MNHLKKIAFILFFVVAAASAQVKKVQFLSDETQMPLAEVEVYDGNALLGKSDANGHLDIQTVDVNYLRIEKEDYEDIFIKVTDLKGTVMLEKIKPIQLREVVVGKQKKINVRKVLDGIRKSLKDFNLGHRYYTLPYYYNMTNKLVMETDTLHYLKGLIKGTGSFNSVAIDRNFRLVKRFKIVMAEENNIIEPVPIYSVNKKGVQGFFGLTIYPYAFDNEYVLSYNIFEKRKGYDYAITRIGNFYKVQFVSKNRSPFGFDGYIIVDKKDFGIYEFKAHLSEPTNKNNLKNTGTPLIDDAQKYRITGSDYYTKCQKDKEGNYQVLCSYSDKKFEQTEGNFKGKKFSYSNKMETSDNNKNAEFIDFDLCTYELK